MYPNLKLQLWRTGIRQYRLAQMLGMDEALLSKIVNGLRQPSPEIREKIASLLHSDEHWLFEPDAKADHQKPSSSGAEPALDP
jgi:transcriptional regulator with XRE-family HTH domain